MAKRSNDQHQRLVHLFAAVFTLCLLDKSLTQAQLQRVLRDAKLRAARRSRKLATKRRDPMDSDASALVVYRWQRLSAYLDANGNPKPIPASGPAPSIEALFKTLKIRGDLSARLKYLRDLNQVGTTKDGLYYPRSEATIFPTFGPEAMELLTSTVDRLIETVLYNTSVRGKSTVRLIERLTCVPDLPKSKVPEFKRFVRDQAGGLVETVNDWLESRRGNAPRKPNAPGRFAAGLHAFAFIDRK